VWIVSVTLAAAYFGHTMQNSGPSTPRAEEARKASTTVTLKAVTVPVIAGGALQGYVLTNIAISAKTDLLKNLPQPPDLLLSDEVFKTLYAEEQVDFKHIEKTDLARLSQKIRDNINSRAGAVVAEDVFIEELHYMSKQDASPEAQLHR
jgi:flagellar basal body-associated protein FliL